ncbi:hypothetical protein OIU76_002350 [Salix suchowensis]|nr:hypothetical protein OIU76_002350 [Salix suchowensis]
MFFMFKFSNSRFAALSPSSQIVGFGCFFWFSFFASPLPCQPWLKGKLRKNLLPLLVPPPPSSPSCPRIWCSPPLTKKPARHSSLPPLSRVVDLATLAGPNWLNFSGTGSPKLPAPENSPTWSEILRPVDVPSPRISENDGSSPYYSDSSSHYGSPILAPSELAAGPLKFPVASLLATMDSGPVMQGGVVSAQSHLPSGQAAVNGLNVPGPSDQAPALGSDAPGPSSPPPGQWRNLFSSNRSSSSCPQLQHFVDISAAKTFNMIEDDLDVACDIWKLCLIGYVSGKFPGVHALKNIISSSWNCVAKMQVHESGWIVYKFQSELEKMNVLRGGPYLVYGRPLMLKEMPEYFDFSSTAMTTLPVWVKLPNLPLKCWSSTCLSKIASALGKPVQCDMLTASMTRLSYARILVEINLAEDLPQFINFCLPNGAMHAQAIVYETLPKFCAHCKVIGHLVESCSKAGGDHTQVNVSAVINRSTVMGIRSTALDNRSTAMGNRSRAKGNRSTGKSNRATTSGLNSFSAGNDVLVSEQAAPSELSFGLAAPLDVVWPQDPMVFEASTFPHARQPLPHSRIRQPDPMVETAHAGDWQPVPRKHTSNRQSKSGSGNPQTLALGKVGAASKGKSGVAVGIESVDNGLMASGLDGKSLEVAPQISAAVVLGSGLRAVSNGILGANAGP